MKKLQLNPLTEKQKEVLIFVAQFIRKNGFSPRYVDIATGTEARTPGAIAGILNALQKKEYITYEACKHRGIFLSPIIYKLTNRQIKNIAIIQ